MIVSYARFLYQHSPSDHISVLFSHRIGRNKLKPTQSQFPSNPIFKWTCARGFSTICCWGMRPPSLPHRASASVFVFAVGVHSEAIRSRPNVNTYALVHKAIQNSITWSLLVNVLALYIVPNELSSRVRNVNAVFEATLLVNEAMWFGWKRTACGGIAEDGLNGSQPQIRIVSVFHIPMHYH